MRTKTRRLLPLLLSLNLAALTAHAQAEATSCGTQGQAPCKVCAEAPSLPVTPEGASRCKQSEYSACDPGLIPNREETRCERLPENTRRIEPRNTNITIGTISTSNPTLWIDSSSLSGPGQRRYRIATVGPGSGWFEVNQFCSVLTLERLPRRASGRVRGTFGLAQLPQDRQRELARTLIGHDSLDSQTQMAEQRLSGTEVPSNTVVSRMQLSEYPEGTRIWAGNRWHVVGFFVRRNGFEFYDSNTGATLSLPREHLPHLLESRGRRTFVVQEGPDTGTGGSGGVCGFWKGLCCNKSC